jgi:hypothetical protein
MTGRCSDLGIKDRDLDHWYRHIKKTERLGLESRLDERPYAERVAGMQDRLPQQLDWKCSLVLRPEFRHFLADMRCRPICTASFFSDPHGMQDIFPHSDGQKNVFDDGVSLFCFQNSNAVEAVMICKARCLTSASPRVMPHMKRLMVCA